MSKVNGFVATTVDLNVSVHVNINYLREGNELFTSLHFSLYF